MVSKNLHTLCLFFIEDNKKFYKKTNTIRELLSRRSWARHNNTFELSQNKVVDWKTNIYKTISTWSTTNYHSKNNTVNLSKNVLYTFLIKQKLLN